MASRSAALRVSFDIKPFPFFLLRAIIHKSNLSVPESLMNLKRFFLRLGQFILLTLLFLVCYILGALIFPVPLPAGVVAEPGPLPQGMDMLVIGAANVLIFMLILLNTRWHGWKLFLAVAISYYGLQTFMGQIETWYFLTDLTVSPGALPMLFLMGTTVPLLFVPLAMLILGKWKKPQGEPAAMTLAYPASPWKAQWIVKAAILALTYSLLYFLAGYFIAWQNPELVAFYNGVDTGSFFKQMQFNFANDPAIVPFQLFRGLLWALFALPVVRLMKGRSPWLIALAVGLIMSVPLNIAQILSNPLIPLNSVRISHMIETASSTFVYGLIVTCLLHRAHRSWAELLGQERKGGTKPLAAKPA